MFLLYSNNKISVNFNFIIDDVTKGSCQYYFDFDGDGFII